MSEFDSAPDSGPNPYASPQDLAERHHRGGTFLEAVSRGFAAAHCAWPGIAYMVGLIVPLQVSGGVANSVMFSGLFEKLQSGGLDASNGPPSELLLLMGSGCVSCLWLPLLLLGLPWVWGGTAGQVRDSVLALPLQAFTAYAKFHYGPMILLLLIFVGLMIGISIPNAIVNQIVSATEVTPGQPVTMEQMRALMRHPANVISSIATGFLMAAGGTLIALVASAIAARRKGIGDGLSQGFSLCGRHFRSVFKLYLFYILLALPMTALQWLPAVISPTLAVAVGLGFANGLYTAYMAIVVFGVAAAVFAAHEPPLEQVD